MAVLRGVSPYSYFFTLHKNPNGTVKKRKIKIREINWGSQ